MSEFAPHNGHYKRICGVGVDVVTISRMRKAHQKWGDPFLARIFTQDEIDYCLAKANPYPSLGARFAAKEAAFKALSQTGVQVARWHDLEVLRSPEGQPCLLAPTVDGIELHLSLSHTKDMAIAMVVAEKGHE